MRSTHPQLLQRIATARRERRNKLDLRLPAGANESDRLLRIPPDVFELDDLEFLDVSGHAIATVDDQLGRLINLKSLNLGGNALTDIPRSLFLLSQLEELLLPGNQIARIDAEIGRLDKLQVLDVEHNPLISPPSEVASQGLPAIRAYLRELESGLEYFYEARVLVVGDGGVGKTGLMARIATDAIRPSEEVTRGIEIHNFLFPVESGRTFHAAFWDFGGQVVYHSLNRLFFSRRALYLLVVDSRQNDRLYYWLDLIEAHGDASPVVVVKNEKDDRAFDIDERNLRSRFSNIKAVVTVNVASSRGIDAVREVVQAQLQLLPHVGTALPAEWARLREQLATQTREAISRADFEALCNESGIRSGGQQILQYLHDLGAVIHFGDDPVLRETVVLDTQWVTRAINAVLGSAQVSARNGRFDTATLQRIWSDEEFTERAEFLLRLMVRIDLCCQIADDEFLVPSLLPLSEKRDRELVGTIVTEYRYKFLPAGLISHLIAASARLAGGVDDVWQTGVLLKHGDALALIAADSRSRRVRVRTAGGDNKRLLALSLKALAEVHRTYPGINVEEYVPCTCRECASLDDERRAFYRVGVLSRVLSDARDSISCPVSFENVAIKPLIRSVADLTDDDIDALPAEVLRRGLASVDAIVEQRAEQGVATLQEAKLLIVGEPGAGKTSLKKKLLDPGYVVPQKEDSTIGIDVYNGWTFANPYDSAVTFRANLWDFGGQEIQYMTHQFFLTERALYVLVADDRKERSAFDYWFNVISLLGRGSPVLVVLNQQNFKAVSNFDERSYREQYPDLSIDREDLDLAQDEARLKAVTRRVQQMLVRLKHVGDRLPAQWPVIRDALEARKAENYLTLHEYMKLCRQHSVDNEDGQLRISGYLHDLGVVLHFQNESSLSDFVVVNPQWAVDAVYAVLSSDDARKSGGKFSKDWLFEVWRSRGYGFYEREKLLSLMKKDSFELCYEVSSSPGEYIAPLLLPATKPAFAWDARENLRLRFQYPFMPKGMMARLIVKLNTYVEQDEHGHDLVWNRGAVLVREDRGSDRHALTRAQVVSTRVRESGVEVIDVAISGRIERKREFLTIIRDAIRGLHRQWFKEVLCDEMVPCNCELCLRNAEVGTAPHFHTYDLLRRCVEGRQSIQCGISTRLVDPLSLIYDVVGRDRFEAERTSGLWERPVHIEHYHEASENMPNERPSTSKSPWSSGSFYLLAAVTAIAAMIVAAQWVSVWALPVIVLGAVLLVTVIGALQLRQDKNLTQERFITLMRLAFAQIPVLGRLVPQSAKTDTLAQ